MTWASLGYSARPHFKKIQDEEQDRGEKKRTGKAHTRPLSKSGREGIPQSAPVMRVAETCFPGDRMWAGLSALTQVSHGPVLPRSTGKARQPKT